MVHQNRFTWLEFFSRLKLLLDSVYCCILKGQSDTYNLLVFHDMTKFDKDRRPWNDEIKLPKFQFLLNSTLKRCQTQSLVWWWLDQKGANSPNILHSHLYWHPFIPVWLKFHDQDLNTDRMLMITTAHWCIFFQSQKGTNRQEIRLSFWKNLVSFLNMY